MDFKEQYNEWCKANPGVGSHTSYEEYLELMLEQSNRRLNALVSLVRKAANENKDKDIEMYPTVIDEILEDAAKLSEQMKNWGEIYPSRKE